MDRHQGLSRRHLLGMAVAAGGFGLYGPAGSAFAQALKRTPGEILGPFYPVLRSVEKTADLTTLPGKPDGACVDADGCYWIACVYGWAVARVTPDGRVDRLIEVPVEKPSMPAFGGNDMTTVFVTSIRRGVADDPRQPEAGSLFAFDAGVSGLPEPVFGGGPV